jgi:LAS superfamily LD-carboxypeptidase LdcB
MDVSSKSANFSLEEIFGQTLEGKWLKDNAHRFGFIIRFQKEYVDITGYSYEPWHIRYVGEDAAKEIHEKNITLEEYLGDI